MFLPDNTKFEVVENPNLSPIRTENEKIPMVQRLSTFDEIELTYTKEQADQESHRCLKCPTHWCENHCPAGVPVREFIAKVREEDYEGAYQLIREKSAFPEVCSRVCPQEKQCQSECTRSIRTQAVGIGRLERFVTEWHYTHTPKEKKIPYNGKSVAVIGSGPSGLSAAQFLVEKGYLVTVYEKNDRAGGLLEYGIPNMKLGKGVVARKIQAMKDQGVLFEMCADVGRDFTIRQIREENDAIILAVGTGNARKIFPEGYATVKGIVPAVEYLSENTHSLLSSNLNDGAFISAKDKDVVIVGGGDTGNDCVGTALRHGCRSVTQLEMLPQLAGKQVIFDPIPQRPREVKQDSSQIECLTRFAAPPQRYQTTVKAVTPDENGNLKEVTLIRLKEVPGENGRTKMEEIPGTEETIPCQLLVVAAGFIGPEGYVARAFGVETDGRTNIAAQGYVTNVPDVFACGDCRTGQSLVVKAMADGRECAMAVDAYLKE